MMNDDFARFMQVRSLRFLFEGVRLSSYETPGV